MLALITPKIANLGYSNLWSDMSTILGYNNVNFEGLIAKLFANNEQGFFYDPNDLSTMFQDAEGTVPVTAAGQPVGLMLDKSKGLKLGVELWENATPTILDLPEGTTGSYDPVSKMLSNTVPSSLNARPIFRFPFTWQAGKRYLFKGKFKSGYEKLYLKNIRFGGIEGYAQVPVNQTTGEFSAIATSSDKWVSIIFATGQVGDIVIDYISIKEVLGNHAYQTTSSMRPLLVASPQRIDFDTVDDKLITNLPAQLTGCTVIRSAPNVGTQILTGQTIPATYEDNTNHCGLIVINRVLTPSETSAITAEFNKRAGV